MAYGPLHLTPEQFWALTYREFYWLIEGYNQREKNKQWRDAWMLAHLLQPHSKERLKPGMFIGEESSNKWQAITEEEYERLMARKKAH